MRTREKGDVLLHEADTQVHIQVPDGTLSVLMGDPHVLHRENDRSWHYDLGSGQVVLLQLNTRSV